MKWQTKKLEAVANFCLGKMLDQRKNRGELLPYLANINVRWGEFDLTDLREMRFEHHELERYGLQYGDIVMCEGGEPGRCAIWKDRDSSMMIQKALHRIRPFESVNPEFLYYFFLYKGRTGNLSQFFTGATIKHLPREKLALVEVPVPPLEKQRAIASVLSAYDDVIENNQRRIQLLEQAARLLYKEWFVNLRFPGHEHTKIIDGVPEGWKKKRIDERFKTVLGGTPSRKNPEYWGGNVPWINSGEVNKNRILKPTEMLTQEGLLKSASKLMPAGSTVIAITGATLGQVSRLEIECSANQSVVGIFDTEDWMNEWLYLFFSHEIRKIANHATGGAQQHINKEIVNTTEFVEPSPMVIEIFRQVIKPIFAQTKGLELQNISLAKARDLLLPKLMNGEVAV